MESAACRFVRRAPAQSKNSWLNAVSGARLLGRQRARVGSQSCKSQGLSGYARHALRGTAASRCLRRQGSLRRARRHGRGLERGNEVRLPEAARASCWGSSRAFGSSCGRVVQCARSTSSSWGSCRDTLHLVVCCTRHSIPIDEPLAVGH